MKSLIRTAWKSPPLTLEQLESRVPMCAAAIATQPTVSLSIHEQQMLELINRARANPVAEASRQGISLNEGLAAGTLGTHARQPLAPNDLLTNVANGHTSDMMNRRFFAHRNPDGNGPGERAAAAGYYTTYVGENLSAKGLTSLANASHTLHNSLFKSSGHRVNTLLDGYREIGVGLQYGPIRFSSGNTQTGSIVTQLFGGGYPGKLYLTGVAYQDNVDNNFYDAGEGRGGITIEARDEEGNRFSTTTGSSGGYSLRLDAGTYQVLAYSADRNHVLDLGFLTLTDANVKRDVDAGRMQVGLPVLDEIVLTGGGETLLMSDPDFNALDLCRVDIRGTGNNTLIVDVAKVGQVPGSHVLTVVADRGDSVVLGSQWQMESVRISDGVLVRRLQHGAARFDLIGPTDFTNPIDNFDVNGTGNVSATDALVIVNELAARRFSHSLDGAAFEVDEFDEVDLEELSYFDVSADGYVTSLDALRVINEMTRRSNLAIAGGEQSIEVWNSEVWDSVGYLQSGEANRSELISTGDRLLQAPIQPRRSILRFNPDWKQTTGGQRHGTNLAADTRSDPSASLSAFSSPERVDMALLQLAIESPVRSDGLVALS